MISYFLLLLCMISNNFLRFVYHFSRYFQKNPLIKLHCYLLKNQIQFVYNSYDLKKIQHNLFLSIHYIFLCYLVVYLFHFYNLVGIYLVSLHIYLLPFFLIQYPIFHLKYQKNISFYLILDTIL